VQLHRPEVLEVFERRGAALLVVSFAPLDRLREWVSFFASRYLEPAFGLDPPPAVRMARTKFLADPERAAYRAYGLGRHSVSEVYSLPILRQYGRWALEGKPLRKADGDTLQRGGDFVVSTDGKLKLAHLGRDQSQRPPLRDILDALGSA
jgi:hypothetical protein